MKKEKDLKDTGDQNGVMITIDWLKEKHDKFSFDGMLKTIIALNKVTNFWCCYVSDVNDVSEETYNALEAFGFDIAYKGDDEMGHYYLIRWGEVE